MTQYSEINTCGWQNSNDKTIAKWYKLTLQVLQQPQEISKTNEGSPQGSLVSRLLFSTAFANATRCPQTELNKAMHN